MIKVEGLTKRYARTVAVDNISFEVQKGQIVGFLGPNGAGTAVFKRYNIVEEQDLKAAVQVLSYEIRMAAFAGVPPVATVATPFASPVASHEEVEGFYSHLERVMVDTGFLDPANPRRLVPKLRRLFSKPYIVPKPAADTVVRIDRVSVFNFSECKDGGRVVGLVLGDPACRDHEHDILGTRETFPILPA